jgi:hypothetical protein
MAAIMFILNGIIEFLVPNNVCLDTKIESLGGLEAEILALIAFMWWPFWKSKMAAMLYIAEVVPIKN